MTIQEAIKSGKPFKRQHEPEDEWLRVDANDDFQFVKNLWRVFIGASDILADDWEVKP